MQTVSARPVVEDRWEIARALVLVQGALAVMSTIETAVLGTGPVFVLSGLSAVVLFLLAAGVGRGSRRARWWLGWVEGACLLFALFDGTLAVFITRAPLAPVALLTRAVLPVAVLALLHQPRRQA
jgi:hypothetical protein